MSAEAKHTPGPLGIRAAKALMSRNVYLTEEEIAAVIEEETAAPDLLEALKETLEAIELVTPDAPEPLPESVIGKARAAIAKAEPPA